MPTRIENPCRQSASELIDGITSEVARKKLSELKDQLVGKNGFLKLVREDGSLIFKRKSWWQYLFGNYRSDLEETTTCLKQLFKKAYVGEIEELQKQIEGSDLDTKKKEKYQKLYDEILKDYDEALKEFDAALTRRDNRVGKRTISKVLDDFSDIKERIIFNREVTVNKGSSIDDVLQVHSEKDIKEGHKLGQGAYGAVTEAQFKDGPVAIKRLKEHDTNRIQSTNDLKNFECVGMWLKNTPNVVRSQAFVVELLGENIDDKDRFVYVPLDSYWGGKAYLKQLIEDHGPICIRAIVMPVAKGKVLSKILEEENTLDQKDRKIIAKTILNILIHLANRGIIHRDIKPENIFCNEQSRKPKLLDFGVATKLPKGEKEGKTRLSALKSRAGTPQYIHPTVASNKGLPEDPEYGPEADMYSYAMLLLELRYSLEAIAALYAARFTNIKEKDYSENKEFTAYREGAGKADGSYLKQLVKFAILKGYLEFEQGRIEANNFNKARLINDIKNPNPDTEFRYIEAAFELSMTKPSECDTRYIKFEQYMKGLKEFLHHEYIVG